MQYWCWVGGQQSLLGDKIGGEYVWLWLTIIVSFMVYIPIYLRRLGYLKVGNWKRDSMQSDEKGGFTRQPKLLVKQQKPAAASLALLAYVCVLFCFFLYKEILPFLRFCESASNDLTVTQLPTQSSYYRSALFAGPHLRDIPFQMLQRSSRSSFTIHLV